MKKQTLFILLLFCFRFVFSQCDPSSLTATNITSSEVTLSWQSPSATSYNIKWRISGSTTTWNANNTNVNLITNISVDTLTINSLLTNTSYDWRVRPVGCTPTTNWWDGPSFTTLLSCNITSTISTTDASCNNTLDGAANLTASGGATPYSYSWNNGITTEDLIAVGSGVYIVTISDSIGCILNDTAIIGFNGNKSINQVITAFIDTSRPNYPEVVTAHNIWVFDTLTIANTGCDVNIRPEFIVTLNGDSIQQGDFTLKWFNPIFQFWPNVPYTINNNGNASGYWHPSSNTTNDSIGVNLSVGSFQQIIIKVRFNNPANYGTYTAAWETFEVDSVGNKLQALSAVDSVDLTLVDCSVFAIDSTSSIPTSCNNSSDGSAIIVSMVNGSGNYSYLWGVGGNTNYISNLNAGIYNVIVIDSSYGCSDSTSIVVSEPSVVTFGLNTTNETCFGSCDGIIDVTGLSGGTTPYSFAWSNNATTQNIDSLCAGNYWLSVTDFNGCASYDSVVITSPDTLTIISDSITNVNYFGTNTGFVYTSVTGGNSSYNYSWAGPNGFLATTQNLDSVYVGTYILTVTDSLGCNASMQFIVDGPVGYPLTVQVGLINVSCNTFCDGSISVTPNGGDSIYSYTWTSSNGFTSNQKDLFGLCAGIYDLLLSDSSGNILTTSYQISEPNPLSINITTDSALCNGGTGLATVYPIGGTPGYSYSWSSGDSNQTTSLVAGDYTILVSDSNGCIVYDSLEILQADSILVSTSSTNASCFGLNNGEISVNITSGGESPFSYSNDNGNSFQTANTFFNLAIGFYDIVIIDANNCIISVTDSISQPQALTFTIAATDATCYGFCDGAITNINIMGGTAPYTWNSGAFDSTALCPGLVNISVTDTNGCIATNTITINEPPPIIVNISQNGNILYAFGDSSITSYQWLDNNLDPISGAISQQYVPVITGEYSVIVTDTNGCSGISFPIMFIVNDVNETNTILNIYPNPTKGNLNVQYNGIYVKSVLLLDINGNIITETNELTSNENNLRLNLHTLPKGIYILQLISDKKIINHSVILQ